LDYFKRPDREQLQLEDLGLNAAKGISSEHAPLRLRTMYLRASTSRSEQSWVLVRIMASIVILLDSRGSNPPLAETNHKRRRKNHHYGDLLRQLKTSDHNSRLAVLQMISFISESRRLGEEEVSGVIEQLVACVSDEDSTVASWAMIAITRYARYRVIACWAAHSPIPSVVPSKRQRNPRSRRSSGLRSGNSLHAVRHPARRAAPHVIFRKSSLTWAWCPTAPLRRL
jgi:hypothetical protein